MNRVVKMLCIGLMFSSHAVAQDQTIGRESPSVPPPYHPKKGACFVAKRQDAGDWKAMVRALNVSWHCSWGASLPEKEPEGVEFVPMIWGYWGTNAGFHKCIAALTTAKSADSRSPLLGFNEPDQTKQANMPVSRALEAWPYLMQTGLRLGSPCAAAATKQWMREFMTGATAMNYRVDFVCVHLYGGPSVEHLVRQLKEIHSLYGKPIWITEFAVADWKAKSREQNRHTPDQVLKFMREALPALDSLDFVERYAWFSAGEDNIALADPIHERLR